MNAQSEFSPPRKKGLLLHGGLGLLLAVGSGFSFWLALQQQVGAYFVLLLMLSILLVPPFVLIMYRGYALYRASYALERDGLRLRWGLRSEDIPLTAVEWVRPASQSGLHLTLPFPALKGAILGTSQVEGLGLVEFMASEAENLVLVATPQRVYAISPVDVRRFLTAFQRVMELGSLTPMPSHSARPAAFLRQVWDDRAARVLLLAGMGLVLGLFIFVSLSIPGLTSVSLGYEPGGRPLKPMPADRLLLLPVLSALVWAGDLLLGLFLYSRNSSEGRAVAYLLWLGSSLTSLLLVAASLLAA